MAQNQEAGTTTFEILESDIDIGCNEFGFIPKQGTDPDGWDSAYARFLRKLGYKVQRWEPNGKVTVSKIATS